MRPKADGSLRLIGNLKSLIEHIVYHHEFFAELYDNNCGYSAMISARSALLALISLPEHFSIGTHPLITRFLKGVFQFFLHTALVLHR